MNVEIVDTAWELAGLIRKLAATNAKPTEATWTVIQSAIGHKLSSSEHWELMSAVNSRLVRLEEVVRSIQDKELDEAQRQRTLQAVGRFASLFDPAQQPLQWQQTVGSASEEDAIHLSWFSFIGRRHQPLRRVTDDERSELIAKLDETISALQGGSDFPEWAKSPLSEGLRRLRFILQHLIFFGCEAAIDQLLDVYGKASAIEGAMEGMPSNKPVTENPTLLSVLSVIVLAANLFWIPDQAATAFDRYRGWYLKLIVQNPRLPKPETRLLAPPTHGPLDPAEGAATVAIEASSPREEAINDATEK